MSKRARYDGAHEAVDVHYPPDAPIDQQESVTVKRGGLLPDEVPAKVRDELLQREDWSEVNQATSPPAKSEKE